MNIGCHVSIAGGIDKAPERARALGCECFQMFTRSPQGGKAPEFTKDLIGNFRLQATNYKLQAIYVHTPYYINFASSNNRIRFGSSSVVRDELERASLIGAKFVMTHLGSAKDLGEKEALSQTIKMLKKTLENYSGQTKLLIENSAGSGKIIGDNLKEISEIIQAVDNKNIAGICLDTQHSFASGYDWNNTKKTLQRIEQELGLEKIKLFHLNNSQSDLGSHVDRHAHLDSGKISLESLEKIVAFAKKNNVDMILETEHDRVMEDMEILKKFRE